MIFQPRLPADIKASLLAVQPRSKVMAWAETADGYVVALRTGLAMSGTAAGSAPVGADSPLSPVPDSPAVVSAVSGEPPVVPATTDTPLNWQFIDWTEIMSGTWDPAAGRLSWRTATGELGEVMMEEPGVIPGLFQERVNAGFVRREKVVLGDDVVIVSAQRRPDQTDLIWRITPVVVGSDIPDELQQLAEQRLAVLKAALE